MRILLYHSSYSSKGKAAFYAQYLPLSKPSSILIHGVSQDAFELVDEGEMKPDDIGWLHAVHVTRLEVLKTEQ
jgi:hypothetical protein